MAFKNMDIVENSDICKRNINQALDFVSTQLGNSRLICKKYYVHPGIIRLYEENKLDKYLREPDNAEPDAESNSLISKEEHLLMRLLSQL